MAKLKKKKKKARKSMWWWVPLHLACLTHANQVAKIIHIYKVCAILWAHYTPSCHSFISSISCLYCQSSMLWMRMRQDTSNLFHLRAFWHVPCEARASFEMKVCSTRDYREHRIMYKFNSQLQVMCLCKKLFETEAKEQKQWVNTEQSSEKHPDHTGHMDK